MKSFRKLTSILLAVLMLVSVMTVAGVSASAAGTIEIYCRCTQSWWTKDDAAVGVHYWGGSSESSWPGVKGTPVSGEEGLWKFEIPSDSEKLVFSRMGNSGGDDGKYWGAKTRDQEIPTDGKNLFTITSTSEVWGEPGADGEWSFYGSQPTTEPTTAPTTEPTTAPTTEPTTAPTTEPTTAPTTEPTTAPTTEPTTAPTTEPTTAPTTEPTTAPTSEPVSDKLVVSASSNLSSDTQSIEFTGKTVTVTYSLTAKDILADGQGVVTYDSSKLSLEEAYNSQATMFPVIKTNLVYNLKASENTMKFNFTDIDSEKKVGKYDFTKGGTLISLSFTPKEGTKGTANVSLNVEELDSVDKSYVSGSVVSSVGASEVQSSISTKVEENPTTAPTTESTQPTVPTQVTDPTQATSPTQATVPGTTEYYVVGSPELFGADWKADPANVLTKGIDGIYYLTKENVPAGTYNFKVVDAQGNWYPAGMGNDGSVTVAEGGKVIFAFDPAKGYAVASADGTLPTYPAETEPTKPTETEPKPTDSTCDHSNTKTTGKKAATYFAKGYTGNKVCADCGEVISMGSAVAKKVLKTPKVTVKGAKKAIKVTYKKVKDAKGFKVTYKLGKKTYNKKFTLSKKELKKAKVTKKIKVKKSGKYKVTVKAFVTSGKKKAYSKPTSKKTVKVK